MTKFESSQGSALRSVLQPMEPKIVKRCALCLLKNGPGSSVLPCKLRTHREFHQQQCFYCQRWFSAEVDIQKHDETCPSNSRPVRVAIVTIYGPGEEIVNPGQRTRKRDSEKLQLAYEDSLRKLGRDNIELEACYHSGYSNLTKSTTRERAKSQFVVDLSNALSQVGACLTVHMCVRIPISASLPVALIRCVDRAGV